LGVEWNTIRQKRKHQIQVCEWETDKTITPTLKQTPHQKHLVFTKPHPQRVYQGLYCLYLVRVRKIRK
jgi:hypothetical protein